MVAAGLLCGFAILRADLVRRGLHADAETIIGVTGLAGLAGARLYHLLEDPAEFFAHPLPLLFSIRSLVWGGEWRICGAGSFGAALPDAYAADAGCLFAGGGAGLWCGAHRVFASGDGRLRDPTSCLGESNFPTGWCLLLDRVHPTPIYEFLVALVIAHFLWRVGGRAVSLKYPAGRVFAWYLDWTGRCGF